MKKILLILIMVIIVIFTLLYIQYSKEMKVAYQRVNEGSNKIVTKNGEIEYSIKGEGFPVLVIHGAGGGYDQGLLLGETFLGNGYKLISVSKFGYLGSPFVGESTVTDQSSLYASLLDELEIDEVIILAVSAGGPSGVQFAHDYPERSNKLILLSAVSKFMGDEIPANTKIVNSIQKSDFAYWLILKLFKTQFLELIGVPSDVYKSLNQEGKNFTDQMLEYMHPMSPRLPGNLHEGKIKPLTEEEMNEIVVPAIIIHAKDDKLVTYDQGEFFHQNLKNSQLISFDSGGHVLASELDTIREKIKKFIRQENDEK